MGFWFYDSSQIASFFVGSSSSFECGLTVELIDNLRLSSLFCFTNKYNWYFFMFKFPFVNQSAKVKGMAGDNEKPLLIYFCIWFDVFKFVTKILILGRKYWQQNSELAVFFHIYTVCHGYCGEKIHYRHGMTIFHG